MQLSETNQALELASKQFTTDSNLLTPLIEYLAACYYGYHISASEKNSSYECIYSLCTKIKEEYN